MADIRNLLQELGVDRGIAQSMGRNPRDAVNHMMMDIKPTTVDRVDAKDREVYVAGMTDAFTELAVNRPGDSEAEDVRTAFVARAADLLGYTLVKKVAK